MKICKLIIRGFQQFENTELDFTDPETGKPVDRICLIGRNGTGKSTILKILDQVLAKISEDGFLLELPGPNRRQSTLFVKLEIDSETLYMVIRPILGGLAIPWLIKGDVDRIEGWIDAFAENADSFIKDLYFSPDETDAILQKLRLRHHSADLLIYAPSETEKNVALNVSNLPQTNLNEALGLFKSFPFHHIVSNETIAEMWRVLVYLVKKRESDRDAFENLEENLQKTKADLIAEFDSNHPKPLNGIADLWTEILDRAGLELDVESASIPIQLNDNLQAYIRLKGTKQRIAYNQLSSGMRDFLFRLGHIYLLYFERNIKRGFLLVDEPENSLFPDFLYDLMETYNRIVLDTDGTSNTQMFFATHSPIVAAQFQPYERVILEWNEHGQVTSKKGVAPIGDDPNDLLRKDFELTHLMGKEGEAKWNEYLGLKKKIRQSSDNTEKDTLIARALEIGQSYGFSTTPD